jgi:hypothetical protein
MGPPLKADFSWQGDSISGITPWGADSISQPQVDEKTTGTGTHQISCV